LERRFVKDERMTLAEWEELYRRRRLHSTWVTFASYEVEDPRTLDMETFASYEVEELGAYMGEERKRLGEPSWKPLDRGSVEALVGEPLDQ
jgi:hypothetical protein